MSKFDLERAKAGDPVQTTCGLEVRVICYDRVNHTNTPIVALVKPVFHTETEEIHTFRLTGNGDYYSLEMKPKIVTRWYSLYKNGPGNFFATEEAAKDGCHHSSKYLQTRSIEFEE